MNLRLSNDRVLQAGPNCRPLIMGILNVTPDSFSDGGEHDSEDAAVAHGRVMLEQGADIVDVGGESTRPGAQRVAAEEQITRTVPVIRRLCQSSPPPEPPESPLPPVPPVLSIDTTSAAVAEAALDAGAVIINDVSAGREDAGMFKLAARRGVPIVLMHMQGRPATMQDEPRYDDVVGEVEAFLLARARAAAAAGVAQDQIIIDPGIGFGKSVEHNLTLMSNLKRLVDRGYPLLLGASRKRFLAAVCSDRRDARPPLPQALLGATCATTALGVAAGVSIFRVHDVLANRQAADATRRILR